MPERPRLLIDNDIFILLAGSNLLIPAISILGFELTDVWRLEPLPHIVRKKKSPVLSPKVADQVIQFCNEVPVVSDEPSAIFLEQLAAGADIDAGEAVLYALLAAQPSYLLASNDKRAMRSIATLDSLQTIRSLVAGRIVCLESLLIKLVKLYKVETIGKELEPVLPIDTFLRVAFSQNCIANPDECLNALHSYQERLVREVGKSFLWGIA